MGNSIVFISKPSLVCNDLPLTRPALFYNDFSYEISKPVNLPNVSLVIELSFKIKSDGALKTSFEFTTQSICKIETEHPESENYILLHRATKIVVDHFREKFINLNLTGYTDNVPALFPYPKYEVLLPVFREIFNPVVGITVN